MTRIYKAGFGAFLIGMILAGVAGSFFLFRGQSKLRDEVVLPAGNSPQETADFDRPFDPADLISAKVSLDSSGFLFLTSTLKPWGDGRSLEAVRESYEGFAERESDRLERAIAKPTNTGRNRVRLLIDRALWLNSRGLAKEAYSELVKAQQTLKEAESVPEAELESLLLLMSETALRIGENDNCVDCRGESSCIFPIVPSAVHTNPNGSQLAIGHLRDLLIRKPDHLEARWLLNIAHMTLGQYPERVDQKVLISIDKFATSEFDIGQFRDVGQRVGVNRYNQAGGAIMDDFDGDGRLDIVVTDWDPRHSMAYFHNKGDGTFEDRTDAAGLSSQTGGLVCYQTDYDNDGRLDIHIVRGAWLRQAIRPSLLKNNGDGTFSDVTEKSGLLDPTNSNAASWADYDNDGYLDLFVASEKQSNRLYHNKGDGTFAECAKEAGVAENGSLFSKGAAWIDFDNDDYPDLFVNHFTAPAKLYRNTRDGKFVDVTDAMGINVPAQGFSCWAWDFDNDGWLDLFASNYARSLEEVVKGLIGQPATLPPSRLFRNIQGQKFEDVTEKVGLNQVFATMGSNFADFDNDGYLDFYLGTGEPRLGTLVPNRMFKNVDGKRFAEITASSRTGHLQKGHEVACGDWDRDGDIDIFIETGGAIDGDRNHNVLFQNPGQGNHWLNLKLVGSKSNRAAIGTRIKLITEGTDPLTIHRHVTTGSSFGANPLEQTLGLGSHTRIATLEIHWPASQTTQVFHDLTSDQAIEIRENEHKIRTREFQSIALPAE